MHCPLCRAETTWEGNPTRPFCSERCKLIDLGHWATERYRIAGDSLAITSTPLPDGPLESGRREDEPDS